LQHAEAEADCDKAIEDDDAAAERAARRKMAKLSRTITMLEAQDEGAFIRYRKQTGTSCVLWYLDAVTGGSARSSIGDVLIVMPAEIEIRKAPARKVRSDRLNTDNWKLDDLLGRYIILDPTDRQLLKRRKG